MGVPERRDHVPGGVSALMGYSHVLGGLIVGVGLTSCVSHIPLPIRLLTIAVAGGSALLPDLDHPSSKVARSLGPITKVIAKGVAALSLACYHATRAENDPADRESGHRLLTHTWPGSAGFGIIVGLATWLNPIAGGVTLALLVGLMTYGLRKATWLILGVSVTICFWVMDQYPGWWWFWGLTVFVGSLAHVLTGDYWTNGGVPLWWPIVRNGRRWEMVRAPATFATGSEIETHIVTPLLSVALVVVSAFASGIASALIGAFA